MSKDSLKIPSCSRRELLDNTALCLFTSACQVKSDERSVLLIVVSRLINFYTSSVYHKVHNLRVILDCIFELSRLHVLLSYKNYDKEI